MQRQRGMPSAPGPGVPRDAGFPLAIPAVTINKLLMEKIKIDALASAIT
jgi:hypothetical protein